jgi:hypothetical protein
MESPAGKESLPVKPIPCQFLEPTTRAEVYIRRFCFSGKLTEGVYVERAESKCPGLYGTHNAWVVIGEDEVLEVESKTDEGVLFTYHETLMQRDVKDDDPRWPTKCAYCDYVFLPTDEWQRGMHLIYTSSRNGERTTTERAPLGAMWYADWLSDFHKGPDGHCLMVRVPGNDSRGRPYHHDWCVDGRASNCTLPEDTEHRCWVRHGVPPKVTVDKNGKTCAAGAGSIATPGWHGYLRNGMLVP